MDVAFCIPSLASTNLLDLVFCIPGLAVLLIHKCASLVKDLGHESRWYLLGDIARYPTFAGEPSGDSKKISP